MSVVWIVWFAAALAAFAVLEARAFRHPDRENTLSRAIYDLGSTWPVSIFLFGLVIGGLAVHFWWHWCPMGSNSIGMIDRAMPWIAVLQ